MSLVPCGNCMACCQWDDQVDTVKPTPYLEAKPNGDCEHLTTNGCGIWGTDAYPHTCFEFDCREFTDTFLDKLNLGCLKAIITAGIKRKEM